MKESNPRSWKAFDRKSHFDIIARCVNGIDIYGAPIASTDYKSNGITEEMANLMAAAPDLLQACKNSLDLLCTGYENGIAKINISEAGDIISQLKNVIKKSEGKEWNNW